MRTTLLARQVAPSLLLYALLIGAALALDFLLHAVGWAWAGRYLGLAGTVLILGSFAYSLRKRKILQRGSPKTLLDLHETLSWAGALMILVHAGMHFNAILPWLATLLLLIVVASGFTGKTLLKEAREHLRAKEAGLKEAGVETAERGDRLHFDSLTVDVMTRWRSVHMPLTYLLAILSLFHIASVVFFGSW